MIPISLLLAILLAYLPPLWLKWAELRPQSEQLNRMGKSEEILPLSERSISGGGTLVSLNRSKSILDVEIPRHRDSWSQSWRHTFGTIGAAV